MDEDAEGYDLESMSEDDKDRLIMALSEAYNTTLDLSVTLSNAMAILSSGLIEDNRFGRREALIKLTAIKMAVLNQYAVTTLGIDVAQMETDAKFEDIVRDLDVEGE